MNIAEILRKLADIADQAQDSGKPDDQIQNPAQLSPTAGGMPVDNVDNVDNEDLGADDAVMVPPLQLKTELLKRAVGVDNIYDEGEPRADQAHENQTATDELAILKNRAGIPTAAVMELGNDEIFDD